jgi:hypothetical protein
MLSFVKSGALALCFLLASQTEAIQTLVRANIAEYRFHDRHPVAVYGFALLAVDPLFHPVGIDGASLQLKRVGDLPSFAFAVIRRLRVLHALMLLDAMPALE